MSVTKIKFTEQFARWPLLACVMAIGIAAPSSAGFASAQSASVEYALAAGSYSRGQWSESGGAFAELIRKYPGTAESASAQFFLAEVMMQRQDFESALSQFRLFLKNHPDHQHATRAVFRTGESAYRLKQYDVAIRMLEEYVEHEPTDDLNEFALSYLGEMRLRREEPQLAQRAFETALKRYPSGILSNQCRMGLAKAFQRQGSDFEATRFYHYLISQNDAEMAGESRLHLGIMSFGKQNFEEAESFFTAAVSQSRLGSTKTEASYWLARTRIERHDFDQAVEIFKTIVDQSLEEKLSTSILFDGAVSAAKTGDEELALKWLEQLRTKFPASPLVPDALAFEVEIHQERGDSGKSLELIQKIRRQPDAKPINVNLLETEGRGLYAAKRFRESAEVFGMLIEENEKSPSVLAGDVAHWRYLKSVSHLGLGEFAEADGELKHLRSIPLSPQLEPLVKIASATAYLGSKDFERAILDYQVYLQLAPQGDSAERARSELTVCLAELARWDEASIAFDDLVKEHGESPFVLANARFLSARADRTGHSSFANKWYQFMAQPGNPSAAIEQGLSGMAWLNVKSSDDVSTYKLFQRLLCEFPNNEQCGQSALARAKFLETQSRPEQTSQQYELIMDHLKQTPWASRAMLGKASLLQKSGEATNRHKARTLLLNYLDLPQPQPNTDEALFQLSWLNHDLGLSDESKARFSQLVDEYPDSKYWPDSAYRVVREAVARGDLETANRLLKLLVGRPTTPATIVSRCLFLQGQIAAGDNRWQAVAESMRQIIPDCEDSSLKTKSEYWLAESLFRMGEYDEALKVFEPLMPTIAQVDAHLEPWIHLRTAQCYGKQSDWLRAAEVADAALNRFSDFDAAYEFDFVIGRSLEDAGRLADARVAFEKVIASELGGSTETAANAQWRIGETFFHQDDFKQAIQAYYKVDSLFSYVRWRSAALMQAGKCQERLHRNPHAIKLYTQLIEQFPDSQYASDARTRRQHLVDHGDGPKQRVGQQPTATIHERRP